MSHRPTRIPSNIEIEAAKATSSLIKKSSGAKFFTDDFLDQS